MPSRTTAIVVGVDGSAAGARAAVWAVDEAISREIPLRLVGGSDSALRPAAAAVRATGRQITVETQVVTSEPERALVDASRTAAMVCLGGTGPAARALLESALCPIAVVRGPADPANRGRGQVAVEIDEAPDSAAVLQFAVAEARLRSAPLHVLGTARLDDQASHWRHRYPDLDVTAARGSLLDHLARHADEVALVVLGAGNPSAMSVLDHCECTVLVVDRQRLV